MTSGSMEPRPPQPGRPAIPGLREGERVLWTGRPATGLWGRLKWLKIGLLGLFELLAVLNSEKLTQNLLFLVVVSLWILADAALRRRTSYVLTDSRVLALRPPGRPRYIRIAERPEPVLALGLIRFEGVPVFTLEGLADPNEFLDAYRAARRGPASGAGEPGAEQQGTAA